VDESDVITNTSLLSVCLFENITMSFKFDPFNRTDLVYKTIGATSFVASVLIPKSVAKGKRPLLVHFHGGGLMVGDRMFGDWFPLW
jgi:acetyl esterase/lipase